MIQPAQQTLGLAPLCPAERPLFDDAFRLLAQPISDYSFANTCAWAESLHIAWTRLDDHLCVFAAGLSDLTMLMPPLPLPGATDAALCRALGASFEIMDAHNARGADGGTNHSRIEYVSDELLEHISTATRRRRGLSLSATPMGGDYVYEMARMIDLAGGGLKSKRGARSRFLREHPHHTLHPLTPADAWECEALLDRWQCHGDVTHAGEVSDSVHCSTAVLRRHEAHACRTMLRDMDTLGLTGMSLRVGPKGRLIGFTLGESLSPSQASILIEKTDPEYEGAPQLIFSAFCERVWHHLPECNAGDDWGIPGLRFTKASYRPTRMLNKSILTRQPRVVR